MKRTFIAFGVSAAIMCCTLALASSGIQRIAYADSQSDSIPTDTVTTPDIPTDTVVTPDIPSDTDTVPTPGQQSFGVSIGTVDARVNESGYIIADISEHTSITFVCISGLNDDNESVTAWCFSSSEESVTVPDSIRMIGSNRSYSVTTILLELPENIKRLTVPKTVKSILTSYNGINCNYYLSELYMLGAVPECTEELKVPTVYVCNESYYEEYLASPYFKSSTILKFGQEIEWITVNVENPGEFGETYLTQNDYDWRKGIYVKISGNINEIDLHTIKEFTKIQKLDLSETAITDIPDQFMYNNATIQDIVLPQSVTSIGYRAFSKCNSLKSIEIGGATTIDNEAFRYCYSLEYVDLTGVESVGNYAFGSCSKLSGVDMSGLLNIGSYAFYLCRSLQNANAEKAVTIESYAFSECSNLKTASFKSAVNIPEHVCFECTSLTSIEFSPLLQTIGNSAFYGCTVLNDISLPSSTTSIETAAFCKCTALSNVSLLSGITSIKGNAFKDCQSLAEIMLPSTLRSLGSGAFSGTGLTTLKCKAAIPPTVTGSFAAGVDKTRVNLYVPAFSKNFYRNTSYWSEFYIVKSLEEPVDYIYVDRELNINLQEEDNDILANNPSIELTSNNNSENNRGQLTADGEGTLSAGELLINTAAYSNPQNTGNQYPTLINYATKMRADNVRHSMRLRTKNSWYFISLPYDVKVSDIVPDDNTYWTIRRYDGAARANSETAWKDLTADDTMEAGKGYIISATTTDTSLSPRLTFSSGNSTTKNNIFRTTDVIVPLEEYVSEFANNRSWNLIGNPYPAYYDMHCIEDFTSPITVWNGSNYLAYSPVDDDYVLAPYQAFFVQRPLDKESITFGEAGRRHTLATASQSEMMESPVVDADGRNVFNFNIAGGNSADRTRIVLNPDASADYELDRDAAKFFSDSDIEIYVNGKNANYAIDERPVADGTATIGVRAAKESSFTLNLSGKYSNEWLVMLTDNKTGMTVDLSEKSYSFTATKGDDSNRFTVKFILKDQAGIDSVIAKLGNDATVTATALNGVTIYTGKLGNISVPAPGIYIIATEEETYKVFMK